MVPQYSHLALNNLLLSMAKAYLPRRRRPIITHRSNILLNYLARSLPSNKIQLFLNQL